MPLADRPIAESEGRLTWAAISRSAVSCGPVSSTNAGGPVRLFNTLTRQVADFAPANPPEVGMYTCGPTVYADQHIGNMRAYVFADTLKRVLTWSGYRVRHVINITDVGHLTSDADEGDDKLELAARREQQDRLGDRRGLHQGLQGRPRAAAGDRA